MTDVSVKSYEGYATSDNYANKSFEMKHQGGFRLLKTTQLSL